MRRVLERVDAWWTAPEPRAAGRMGLFRILYCSFYIWHLSFQHGDVLARVPAALRDPVWVVDVLLAGLPGEVPVWVPGAVEALLVAALVLLLFGVRVRVVTGVVLVLGTGLDAFQQSFGKVEHSAALLSFYVPLFMLVCGWGGTYSLDALRRRRAGRSSTGADDDSWRHALPMRAALVLLSLLFVTAVWIKAPGWAQDPETIANLLANKSSAAAMARLPTIPLATTVAGRPALYEPLRFAILAFEAGFPLVLVGPRIRSWYLATALLFHAANALFLLVTFTPVLVVYCMFVDWERLLTRLGVRSWSPPAALPLGFAHAAVLGAAVLAGLAWNLTPLLRDIVNVGGLVDWRTIWIGVVPLALLWWLRSTSALCRRDRGEKDGQRTPASLGSGGSRTKIEG